MYSATVLEARNLRWGCQQGHALWGSGRIFPCLSAASWWFPTVLIIPRLREALLQTPPPGLRGLLVLLSLWPNFTSVIEWRPTLIHYDLILFWLHLQRLSKYCHIHWYWELGLQHMVWGDEIQATNRGPLSHRNTSILERRGPFYKISCMRRR